MLKVMIGVVKRRDVVNWPLRVKVQRSPLEGRVSDVESVIWKTHWYYEMGLKGEGMRTTGVG